MLVPDPGFVSYRSLAHLCQARTVGYGLGPAGALDAEPIGRRRRPPSPSCGERVAAQRARPAEKGRLVERNVAPRELAAGAELESGEAWAGPAWPASCSAGGSRTGMPSSMR